MVKLTVQEMCRKRGLTKPHHLWKRLQDRGYMKTPTQANNLWNEKGDGVKFETIDMLCDALDCKVSDLLVRTNGEK